MVYYIEFTASESLVVTIYKYKYVSAFLDETVFTSGEISTMKNQGFVIIENYKSAYVTILERDIIGDSWSDAIHHSLESQLLRHIRNSKIDTLIQ